MVDLTKEQTTEFEGYPKFEMTAAPNGFLMIKTWDKDENYEIRAIRVQDIFRIASASHKYSGDKVRKIYVQIETPKNTIKLLQTDQTPFTQKRIDEAAEAVFNYIGSIDVSAHSIPEKKSSSSFNSFNSGYMASSGVGAGFGLGLAFGLL